MRGFVALGVLCVVLLTSCADVRDEPSALSTAPSVQLATPAPLPVVVDGPVAPLPDVSLVMDRGERVAYSVCSRVTGWQKPDIAGMAQVFTDRRFGDGERPFPVNYALYLQRAYYISTPTANSVNKELNAFSAQWAAGERSERFCDFQALRSDPSVQMLYLDGYHMQEMRFLNGHFVVLVSSAPGVREDVVFHHPGDMHQHFSLRVASVDGGLVYEIAHDGNTSRTVSYRPDGAVVAVTLSGDDSFTAWPVTFAEGQPPLRVFIAFGPPFVTAAYAGTLAMLGAQGSAVATASWPARDAGWEPLATLDVPVGTYEFKIEAECPTTCTHVLIAEDVPLP